MKLNKKQLELEKGIQKEWLITNGLGGYASSTVIHCNTRKYHGLLIAPLTPPARRFLILSKVDESIKIGKKEYPLYTNMCSNFIASGYQYLKSFEKEDIPIFHYEVEEVAIKKEICMKYGGNTVCLCYTIKNGKEAAKFTLAPVLNFRDFHTMNTNHDFKIQQNIQKDKIKIVVDQNSQTPIYIRCSAGNYILHEKDIFKNMFYLEEEKRGFYPEEDHFVSGRFEIELQPEEEKKVTFVCSLEENIEELDGFKIIEEEKQRINLLEEKANIQNETMPKSWIRDYVIAMDQFIVYRPTFRLHTLIAGYPWFLDWGRDAFISYEGTLLLTKRWEEAKEVLLTFTKNIKYGLVPNGYSGFDNRPLYNSADASLLLFEQVKKYMDYTKDEDFIKEKIYPLLKHIIQSYQKGIDYDDNNIYLDTDYLLVTGTPNTQNTWMDAKYNGKAVTPRNGKTVEMNSLWYNALKIMQEFTKKWETKEESTKYEVLANKCKKTFMEQFYCAKKKSLYDVLGDEKVRPNQLFSMSLSYPILDPTLEIAEQILQTVEKKLLMKNGLKTLAKEEKDYVAVYEGSPYQRDLSYHQGITWPWLLGLYYDTLKNKIKLEKNKAKNKENREKLDSFKQQIKETFSKGFYQDKMVGSIAELYDSKAPYLAKGAPAQCWSIAEIGRIVLGE